MKRLIVGLLFSLAAWGQQCGFPLQSSNCITIDLGAYQERTFTNTWGFQFTNLYAGPHAPNMIIDDIVGTGVFPGICLFTSKPAKGTVIGPTKTFYVEAKCISPGVGEFGVGVLVGVHLPGGPADEITASGTMGFVGLPIE